MTVERYRSIEEMPRVWRSPDDPENLRLVARMLAVYRSLVRGNRKSARVERFRTLEAANIAREDPWRA